MRVLRLGGRTSGAVGKGVILACVAAAALLASGCALTKDTANISYTAAQGTLKVKGAEAVKVAVAVTDQRSIKDKVSCKKNGYGMEMAAIEPSADVPTCVANAIAAELGNRGFTSGDNPVVVAVELIRFYNDFKTGFWSGDAAAEVVMNVQVRKPDGSTVFSKTVTGAYTETGLMMASGGNAEVALNGAFKDAVLKLVNDSSFIDAAIKASAP